MTEAQSRPAPRSGALQVFGNDSPTFVDLRRAEVVTQVEALLSGCDLTYERLLTDMGAYLTANPKIAAFAKPPGLFNSLITAARHQTTFGDGGMWIIPDGGDVRPQESKRFIVDRAKKDYGVEHIRATLVFKADEPVQVERDSGQITGFTLNNDNFLGKRITEDLLGGFGVAVFQDSQKPNYIEWFSKADLERRRGHSAAFKKSAAPAWKTDELAMFEGSIEAAIGRRIAPIRTKIPGQAGGLVAPITIQGVVDGDFEEVPERFSFQTSEDVAEELNSRGKQEEEPETTERKSPPRIDINNFPKSLHEDIRGKGPVAAAFNDLMIGYYELHRHEQAVYNAYVDGRATWAAAATEVDLNKLTDVIDTFFTIAATAGYQQPERKKGK